MDEEKKVVAEEPEKVEKTDLAPDEEVRLPASQLQGILDQISQQNKAIEILKESVSQGRLLDAENKRKPVELPKAFLKVFMGKIVTSWKTEKAETLYHPTNSNVPVGEILKATYTFMDGTNSGVQDQVLFTRCEDRVVISILNGKDSFKDPNLKEFNVRALELITADENLRDSFVMPQGEFKIDRNFVNP